MKNDFQLDLANVIKACLITCLLLHNENETEYLRPRRLPILLFLPTSPQNKPNIQTDGIHCAIVS